MRTSEKANGNNGEISDAALRRRIEERAYYIWLASGQAHGDHERHWLEAERELRETARQQRQQRKQRAGGREGRKAGKPNKSQ
jgi:Protein of unknown function (DUF2934)